MSRSFTILVNPIAGGGSAPKRVAKIAPLLTAAGARVRVEASPDAAVSRQVAARAIEAGDVVVAAGGDGMLASIAATVVAHQGVMGIIASGRGNDFARMLGLPSQPELVAAMLLEAEPRGVDVIKSGEDIVLGSLYAGVDSLASQIVDEARGLPSAVQYPYAAVRSLLSFQPREFTITVDGAVHRHKAYSVVVGNSAYYGKGMKIAPTADVHDGILDIVVLPASSRLSMVRRLRKVYDGSHVDLPGVTVLRGKRVRLEAASLNGVPQVVGYGDGERLGDLPREAEVLPGGIQVVSR